ncbi:MAG: hypothetical protein CSA95_00845 [Bacteroidetes bacterium]|nr:MAG: hypothetical protein CSA95_00845 [Bacteroidota bacterium]PIE88148.1 MAG: hypothetical protein CSA04_03375 [Bacteroidota bacterium]
MEFLNDNQILEGIRDSNEEIVKTVYKEYFKHIQHLVTYNHGTVDDAKDLFQDAMIVICERLQSKELTLSCSFGTFLYAIARNIWLRRLAEKGKTIVLTKEVFDNSMPPCEVLENNLSLHERRMIMFQRHFDTLTKSCKKIIKMMLKKEKTKKIQQEMGYNSLAYTRKRKYQCKKALIKRIRADHDYPKLKEENEDTTGEVYPT